MFISLEKATLKDINKIHEIQVLSFKSLLEKYKDYNIIYVYSYGYYIN